MVNERKTTGEEFQNRSRGAKEGWKKRLRQAENIGKEVAKGTLNVSGQVAKTAVNTTGRALRSATLTLTRPDIIATKKIQSIKAGAEFLGDELLTGGTLAFLLLTKRGRGLSKETASRVFRGTKSFLKEGFGDLPGKALKTAREKSPLINRVSDIIETVGKPAGKGVQVTYEATKVAKQTIDSTKKNLDEIGEAIADPQVRSTRQLNSRLAVKELDADKPAISNIKEWLAWRGKRDREQIRAWTGFNKAQEEFWINFNSRRDLTDTESSYISFVVDKDKLYFSQRKPMSAATKRKISRSLARSRGATQGYDNDNQPKRNIGNAIVDTFDATVERVEKVNKAISPMLRYFNERENIAERRKRRQLATVNTAIYGVGTGTRAIGQFTISPSERAKMKLRRELASEKLALDTQKLDLSGKALAVREDIGRKRLDLGERSLETRRQLGSRNLDIRETQGNRRLSLQEQLGTRNLDLREAQGNRRLSISERSVNVREAIGQRGLDIREALGNQRLGIATEKLGLDTKKLELGKEALRVREDLGKSKVAASLARLGPYRRQTISQRMEVLRKMEVSRKSPEWRELLKLEI